MILPNLSTIVSNKKIHVVLIEKKNYILNIIVDVLNIGIICGKEKKKKTKYLFYFLTKIFSPSIQKV